MICVRSAAVASCSAASEMGTSMLRAGSDSPARVSTFGVTASYMPRGVLASVSRPLAKTFAKRHCFACGPRRADRLIVDVQRAATRGPPPAKRRPP